MTKRASRKRRKTTSAKKTKRSSRSRPASERHRWRRFRWRYVWVSALLVFAGYVFYLDYHLQSLFDNKRWSVPARVYARPLELYTGLEMSPRHLQAELEFTGYRASYDPKTPGTYHREGRQFTVITRSFQFWDGYEPSRQLRVVLDAGRVSSLVDAKQGAAVNLVRLDPAHIGGIYPTHNEDRILVNLEQVPQRLQALIVAVEDRNFRDHHGLDFRAIGRALWANIKAGTAVQGGSTLTQQLVKNFFLDNRRTLWRKFNEAVMAVLLELHYDKDAILEAYINEVYLGQQGSRAIHGFGLASRFYFDKAIGKLELSEMATLVALVRGPTHYHPQRHPQRLRTRRNLVLQIAQEQNVLTDEQARRAQQTPLGVVLDERRGLTEFPAFMDLVKRQLHQYYRPADLSSAGLQIFTTLDPTIQRTSERIVESGIESLDKRHGLNGSLQGAALVSAASGGEVLALVGGRNPRFAGFNRALDAARPVGSLLKPAVYLTALQQPQRYNLLTPIEDKPVSIQLANGQTWSPANYDRQSHGEVFLYQGLIHSYNQATVRLGMRLGLGSVTEVIHSLGVQRKLPSYPSMLLGAVELTPFEVAQMYQTLASGGFRTPLRAIREVLSAQGQPLRRYPLQVQQAVDPAIAQVMNSALIQVVERGTGRSLKRHIPSALKLAGKTGTTDDSRDSWFAGYSAKHSAVVWLGLDDNRSTGLTGASGALPIWGALMDSLGTPSLTLTAGEEIEILPVDPQSGLIGGRGCSDTLTLAFIQGTAPKAKAPCAGGGLREKVDKTFDWFRDLFD